jgi:long-chain acyl-CoA synthetase
VTHTHHTLERTVVNYLKYSELRNDDIFGIFASVCHIAAFTTQLLPAVSLGATLLLFPSFAPEPVLRSFQEHRVTQCFGLPVLYNALVNCPGAASFDVRSLRFCLAGGDAVPTELQRRFQETFGVEITEACGMTEVIPYCGNPPYGRKKTGSIGPPTPGVSIRIVDPTGRDVPPGEPGEILVQSEGNMVGYWENPEATAETLENGWLHTGDLGRVDEDGYYWFVGRAKEIIVRGGSNISPLEVEEILYQHPAVKEAAVVGVPDPSWGEVVQAYVALKDADSASEEELLGFLRERIAAYKVPESITFLPDLPKGLTGKVHRKTLKDQAIAALQ